ncbi:MAG: hypothetical protein A2284_04140 [Deltaproteobacteria bacterium RIFOXYA12_FULL_61_11]|nr:MAG: hypothetical protein A2284_04140 [Deltaproteobacteria bacterium RIFOXYA12_FULL_61_11]
MRKGTNPRSQEIQQQLASIKLKELFERYSNARPNLKANTLRDYRCCMNNYFADWRDVPLQNITRDKVEKRHQELSRKSPARANIAMRFLRALLNFASDIQGPDGQPVISDNPVERLSRQKRWNAIEPRSTFLTPIILPLWWQALYSLPAKQHENEIVRDYLLFLLFTGLRREEAMTLRWEQVDFEQRSFKVLDTKNRKDHELPMSTFLLTLLTERKERCGDSPWVFPSSKSKTGHIIEPRYQIALIEAQCGIRINSHDLRRTFASYGESLGFSFIVLKHLLNHKVKDITGRYVQITLEQKREPMERIAKYILENAEKKS